MTNSASPKTRILVRARDSSNDDIYKALLKACGREQASQAGSRVWLAYTVDRRPCGFVEIGSTGTVAGLHVAPWIKTAHPNGESLCADALLRAVDAAGVRLSVSGAVDYEDAQDTDGLWVTLSRYAHWIVVGVGVLCLVFTDIFSGHWLQGGLLPALDVLFFIYLVGYFVARRYQRRTHRTDAQLVDGLRTTPPD